MYIRVLCTIIYQSDDLALSASDNYAQQTAQAYPHRPISGRHSPWAVAQLRYYPSSKDASVQFGER